MPIKNANTHQRSISWQLTSSSLHFQLFSVLFWMINFGEANLKVTANPTWTKTLNTYHQSQYSILPPPSSMLPEIHQASMVCAVSWFGQHLPGGAQDLAVTAHLLLKRQNERGFRGMSVVCVKLLFSMTKILTKEGKYLHSEQDLAWWKFCWKDVDVWKLNMPYLPYQPDTSDGWTFLMQLETVPYYRS